MRRYTATTLRALLVIAPTLIAWTPANPVLTLAPESRLWVDGTSTLRAFQCKAASLTAHVETQAPEAVRAVLAGEKAVRTVEVRVPAAALDCGNGKMNDHMRKALKAKDHEMIEFRLASYATTKTADGVTGEITGVLTLGGVQQTITMQGSASDGGNGTLRVVGTHELLMSEYGLKAPTLMLGTLKVGDRVKVGFDLALKD
jgi:polyisoprenoid-binding protein YceI